MDKEIKPKQKYENGKRVLVYDIPTAEYVERTIIDVRKPTTNLKYHYSFDAAMPVWSKLRTELKPIFHTELPANNIRAINLKSGIKNAILNVDITTAHALIFEAIEWLNKNK